MGWGAGVGGFFEGYSKTMNERHAQRQEQFKGLMQMAGEYNKIADKHRDVVNAIKQKSVWDEKDRMTLKNSQTIIDESTANAQKAVMDAEKSMNQKIGGLAKLGGMIKNMVTNRGGVAAQPTSGTPLVQPDTGAQPASATPPAAPEPSAISPPPPTFTMGLTPEQEQWAGLPKPPGRAAAPAITPPPGTQAPSPAGLPPGQEINPEFAAKQAMELASLRSKGKVETEIALDRRKQEHTQDIKTRTDEFDDRVPSMQAAGYTAKQIERARVSYITQMPNIMGNTAMKTEVDKASFKDPTDNQWKYRVYSVDTETGTRSLIQTIPASPPAYATRLNEQMQEKVENYKALHGITDDDEAEKKVRSIEGQLLENKLEQSKWKAVSEKELADYRGDRTKYYKIAQEAKVKGKGMTPQLANTILTHSDSMARVDLSRYLSTMDAAEAHMKLVNQSNQWLMQNVGLSRDEIVEIIRGKAETGERKEVKTSKGEAAARTLLSPPVSGSTSPTKKSGGSTSPP